jgi:hypothetical protein
LATIERLCARLCDGSRTATALAADIGGTIEDQGGGFAIVVQPADPAFHLARVVRAGLDNAPASIELTFADPSALSLSDPRATLGAGAVPGCRKRPGMQLRRPSRPHSIRDQRRVLCMRPDTAP